MELLIILGLAGAIFTTGFLTCHFVKEYRARVMFYLYGKAIKDYPCQERLEKTLGIWKDLRIFFYSWRGGLSPNQYFDAVALMIELDEILGLDANRETDPIIEKEEN